MSSINCSFTNRTPDQPQLSLTQPTRIVFLCALTELLSYAPNTTGFAGVIESISARECLYKVLFLLNFNVIMNWWKLNKRIFRKSFETTFSFGSINVSRIAFLNLCFNVFIDELVNPHYLEGLRHVPRVPNHPIRRWTTLSDVEVDWRRLGATKPRRGTYLLSRWQLDLSMLISVDYLVGVWVIIVTSG